jgi:hypothetical protein
VFAGEKGDTKKTMAPPRFSTTFDGSSTIETGAIIIVVIANGIPSKGMLVTVN